MKFFVKQHGEVLAACDESVLGKKLSEKDVELNVRREFYGGRLVSEKDLVSLLSESNNINLVGDGAVKAAEKAGFACNVLRIKNVPYSLIFRI